MTDATEADVAGHWNANADQWAGDVRAGFDVYRDRFTFPAFMRFAPPLAGLKVIDFGCGEGTNTRAIARTGARMTGIDLSERLIELARGTESADPLGIDFRVASFSADTGYAGGSFDAVVSTMALMDGPDFEGAMREARRLLRPGGTLVFSILHPCFITPGLRWEKDAAGRSTGLRVSHYFDRSPFTERWYFAHRPGTELVTPFSVPRFPRTLADYVNGVLSAGLRLTRMDEPRPDPALCEEAPRFGRWRDVAAFLLLIEAERPV